MSAADPRPVSPEAARETIPLTDADREAKRGKMHGRLLSDEEAEHVRRILDGPEDPEAAPPRATTPNSQGSSDEPSCSSDVATPEPFPAPRRQSVPCGECHLQRGETCDICGAKENPAGSPSTTPEPQYGPLVDVPYAEADWPRWLMLVAEREPRGRGKATFAAISRALAALAEPSPESGALLEDFWVSSRVGTASETREAREALARRLSTLERDAALGRALLTALATLPEGHELSLSNDGREGWIGPVCSEWKRHSRNDATRALAAALSPSGEPTTERGDNG